MRCFFGRHQAQSNVAKGKVPSDKAVDTASLQQADPLRLLVTRTLLVAPGITTSSKKLLVIRASLLVTRTPNKQTTA